MDLSALPSSVGVFEDDDLVVGGLTGLELGVGPGASDPEAAARVPLHVDGVFEHGLGGEEVSLVAVEEEEVFALGGGVMIVHELQVGAFEVGLLDAGDVGFFGGGEGGEGEEGGGEGGGGEGGFEKGHGKMGGMRLLFFTADFRRCGADLTGLKAMRN